ncbi:MAG: 4Fe-4S binding protein [Desulfovibrionaceae bacterium]
MPTPFRFRLAQRHIRLAVQAAFTLTSLWIGWRFFAFLSWVMGRTDVFAPRPAGVEGFLPISAFMALRRWLVSGLWDRVHPAGLTILVAALAIALIARKGFCAYICPVGCISHLLELAGKKLGMSRDMPSGLGRVLGLPKYLLLGFFVVTVWQMPLAGVRQFLNSPYNWAADAKLLQFFLSPSGLSLAVLGLLAVASLVWRNAWCRFLCPYGALLGLLGLASPLGLTRDATTCIDCGKCARACPSQIDVPAKTTVNTPLCIGCMQCADACPVPDCLTPRLACRVRVPLWLGLALTVGIFVAAWVWAMATGHWETDMPLNMLRMLYLRGLGQ